MDTWMKWVVELQALAQSGLEYSRDPYDIERFSRIREITVEMMAHSSGLPVGRVRELFASESGYQTPKLDTRAAVFDDEERILLVRETLTGEWSLPGGWADVLETLSSNVAKEVREEAGIEVAAERVIAILDKNTHNPPVFPGGIWKVFVLCRKLGGEFRENIETSESGWFKEDALPALSIERNTPEQLALCFEAFRNPAFQPVFD